jgi:[NiFe] hydrogenase diaphorase moiety small subunit
MNQVEFTVDGRKCQGTEGGYLTAEAEKNGVYIPTLCNVNGVHPRGSCRVCNVKINGRFTTACTTPLTAGMTVENETEEITELRRQITELLFTEGNHFCPSCEKSGQCELQALAYRFGIMHPRYDYMFPVRPVEAEHTNVILDHNRCILCKRCIRGIKDDKGRSYFAFSGRGQHIKIILDKELSSLMDHETAKRSSEICPVGAILIRENGYRIPIGKRMYDHEAIGSHLK